jgi:hypothetical protein
MFPTSTYCYSIEELVFYWDKPVAVESFWLRLHLKTIHEPDIQQRSVRMYLDGTLVLQTAFYLSATEWFLVRPSNGRIVVDQMVI